MNSQAYEILSLIEQGSAGALYHGRDHERNIDVAFRRFYSAGDPEAFSAKAPAYFQLTQRLKDIEHKNLLAVLDSGVDEDGPYLIHQLLAARSFQELVAYEIFDERRALSLASQLLSGLGEAHRQGFAHGALHPSSILMMDREGRGQAALIQDLGIHQITKLFLGTDSQLAVFDPVVSAPERFSGDVETVASDLFTVGQIVYISLIGGHPFSGESSADILLKHQQSKLPTLQMYRDDISQEFRAWIRWLVNPDPSARPESAEHAFDHLPSGIPTAPLTSPIQSQQFNDAVAMQANRLTEAMGVAAPQSTLIGTKSFHDTAPIVLRPMGGPTIKKSQVRIGPGSKLASAQSNVAANSAAFWIVLFLIAVLIILTIAIIAS